MAVTYVEAVRTGRGMLDQSVPPTMLLLGSPPLEIHGDVTTAVQWAQARFNVFVYLLRDVWGLSRSAAINAATCLVAWCALVTTEGASEWNYNVSGAPCEVNGTCARTPDGVLLALANLAQASTRLLEDVDRVEGLRDAIARGDVGALARLGDVGLRRLDGAALTASLTRARALIADGNAATLAELPGGGATVASASSSDGYGLPLLALGLLLAFGRRAK